MPTPSEQVAPAEGSSFSPRTDQNSALLILLGVLPFAALCALFALDVPLGQPGLVYRYSPLVGWRIERAAIGAVIGCVGVFALARWTRRRDGSRRETPARERFFNPWLALAATGYLALIAWSFLAPPQAILQHTFNMLSPSHEGAFVLETRHVNSIRSYVSRDFCDRLQLSPEEMRGRRVLSNPPGMTVTAAMVRDGIGSSPRLERGLVALFGLTEVEDPALRREMAAGLTLAMLLTVAWGASILPFLLLFREFCPPLMAIALAFACVFNPSTIHFTPGKDAAQLLFIGLLCWCAARTMIRGRCGYAFAGGVILTISLATGLIHAWVALILVGATLWQTISLPRTEVLSSQMWLRAAAIPAGIAMALTASVMWLAADWNVFLHAWRVGRRYGEIQLPIITDPLGWTFVGAGLFLMFMGSTAWALPALRRKPVTEAARFGTRLLVLTSAVMAYSYFFGNNSETPRLWMPFIPLLICGLAIRRGSCVKPEPTDTVARAVDRQIALLLLTLQLLVTLAHWSLLDVRESEFRLVTGRMWD